MELECTSTEKVSGRIHGLLLNPLPGNLTENQREIAIILNSEGGSKFEYADGESDHTVWPNGTPSDGTPVEIEKFPYLWLVVTSYVFNSIVIVAALVCLVFTILFRKRKLVYIFATTPIHCVNTVLTGVIWSIHCVNTVLTGGIWSIHCVDRFFSFFFFFFFFLFFFPIINVLITLQ